MTFGKTSLGNKALLLTDRVYRIEYPNATMETNIRILIKNAERDDEAVVEKTGQVKDKRVQRRVG